MMLIFAQTRALEPFQSTKNVFTKGSYSEIALKTAAIFPVILAILQDIYDLINPKKVPVYQKRLKQAKEQVYSSGESFISYIKNHKVEILTAVAAASITLIAVRHFGKPTPDPIKPPSVPNTLQPNGATVNDLIDAAFSQNCPNRLNSNLHSTIEQLQLPNPSTYDMLNQPFTQKQPPAPNTLQPNNITIEDPHAAFDPKPPIRDFLNFDQLSIDTQTLSKNSSNVLLPNENISEHIAPVSNTSTLIQNHVNSNPPSAIKHRQTLNPSIYDKMKQTFAQKQPPAPNTLQPNNSAFDPPSRLNSDLSPTIEQTPSLENTTPFFPHKSPTLSDTTITTVQDSEFQSYNPVINTTKVSQAFYVAIETSGSFLNYLIPKVFQASYVVLETSGSLLNYLIPKVFQASYVAIETSGSFLIKKYREPRVNAPGSFESFSSFAVPAFLSAATYALAEHRRAPQGLLLTYKLKKFLKKFLKRINPLKAIKSSSQEKKPLDHNKPFDSKKLILDVQRENERKGLSKDLNPIDIIKSFSLDITEGTCNQTTMHDLSVSRLGIQSCGPNCFAFLNTAFRNPNLIKKPDPAKPAPAKNIINEILEEGNKIDEEFRKANPEKVEIDGVEIQVPLSRNIPLDPYEMANFFNGSEDFLTYVDFKKAIGDKIEDNEFSNPKYVLNTKDAETVPGAFWILDSCPPNTGILIFQGGRTTAVYKDPNNIFHFFDPHGKSRFGDTNGNAYIKSHYDVDFLLKSIGNDLFFVPDDITDLNSKYHQIKMCIVTPKQSNIEVPPAASRVRRDWFNSIF